MAQHGTAPVKHIRDLAFMGFAEVAANIRTILNNLKFCKQDILQWQPDVLILIDYPGFNLRIAPYAKARGIKVFYYISPQIWAWRTSRVHKIAKQVDRVFAILPFEKAFYQKYGYEIDYVGHPLLEAVAAQQKPLDFYERNGLSQQPIIALLPGSRRQEITRMLQGMLSVVSKFPDHQFIIAGAPAITKSVYQEILSSFPAIEIKLLFDQTYDLLQVAQAALVASGTATLEAALFEVPQVVCYRGGKINYWLFRSMIKVDYISLVNLILEKPAVKELIQDDFNEGLLEEELTKILRPDERDRIKKDYQQLKEILGAGNASRKTAGLMWQYLNEPNKKA